jgi:threonine synthase
LNYHSTNRRSPVTSFREALLNGLAPDGGLYMPDYFPEFTHEELDQFPAMTYYETAYTILVRIIGDEIGNQELLKLCRDAYNFEVPLERLEGRKYIMRLDQGPTASFKDFAARMMSRLMQHFLSLENKRLTILTATSGDTGSAVASAFHGLENIKVVILYPEKEVTAMQRKQMTTLHDNISVIALRGKFDDCQKLVKQAFMDNSISYIPLSSANSINIGRLLPQSVYYFHAWSRLSGMRDDRVVFSVPSGNFGNLMGGLIAGKMGLPVERFVIATNENDEVPEFLRTGDYRPINPSRNCISSAMNVGHPSNLARIVELYNGIMDEKGSVLKMPDIEQMRKEMFAVSISDDETRETIYDVYKESGLILEPHGAIAWRGIQKLFQKEGNKISSNQLCIALETAHPAKFPDELRNIVKKEPDLPISLSGLSEKSEEYFTLDNEYSQLKEFILQNQ